MTAWVGELEARVEELEDIAAANALAAKEAEADRDTLVRALHEIATQIDQPVPSLLAICRVIRFAVASLAESESRPASRTCSGSENWGTGAYSG